MSAASSGNSEPKQGQRSQSARGFCSRSTMRVPQPDIIEHFGNADAVPQPPERCLSRKAGIMRCCQYFLKLQAIYYCLNRQIIPAWFPRKSSVLEYKLYYFVSLIQAWRCIPAISHHVSMFLSIKQHANLCPRSLHINFRLSPYPAKSHRLVGRFNSKSYNTAHICHFVFSVFLLLRLTE